jgi:signal transduction histidine kinase
MVQQLIIGYLILMIFSLIISLVILKMNPTKLNEYLALYWTCAIFSFFVQGIMVSNTYLIAFSPFSVYPVAFVLNEIFKNLFGEGVGWATTLKLLIFALVCFLFGAVAGYDPRLLSAIPSYSVAAIFFMNVFLSFKIPGRFSISELLFVSGVVLSGLHLLDYPFLRFSEYLSFLGISIAYWNAFLMAVSAPLISVDYAASFTKKNLELQISKATEKLALANNAVHTLLKVVRHDINNCLFVIQGRLAIAESKLDKSNSALLEIFKVQKAALSIQSLIESVRVLELASAQGASLERSDYDAKELVMEAMELVSLKAEDKGVPLEMEIQGNPKVCLNKSLFINSVLCNIITNAIKFSDPGDTVTVKVLETEEGVVFKIIDRGIGMQNSLVDKLNRGSGEVLSRVGTHSEKGSGFGNFITKTILEKMGGSIHYTSIEKEISESEVQSGTTVTIILCSS